MNVPFVDLYAQHRNLKNEIETHFEEIIKNSDFIRSRFTQPFEESFARTIGSSHCISCANGTDALYISMRALGLGPGDEVITTAHSWISTSETITQAGGKVVFCDTFSDDYSINETLIEEKITKKTKGIVAVHLAGYPCNIRNIKKIADKNNLWLIEDCAQGHMAEFDNKCVGTFGDISTFSFYPGKNLGAMGDAGAILTNNSSLAKWIRLFGQHGGKGFHKIEGINSRLDGLQAAILNLKLPYLKEWTQKRIDAAEYYDAQLANIDGVKTPLKSSRRKHVYHLYILKVEKRRELKEFLDGYGIQTVINYPTALPFLPAYSYLEKQPNDFPNAYGNQSKILSIPIFPEITRAQQDYVVNKITEFYEHHD